jgi:hypothetical protein
LLDGVVTDPSGSLVLTAVVRAVSEFTETIATRVVDKTMAVALKSRMLYSSAAGIEAADAGSSRTRVKPGRFDVLAVGE